MPNSQSVNFGLERCIKEEILSFLRHSFLVRKARNSKPPIMVSFTSREGFVSLNSSFFFKGSDHVRSSQDTIFCTSRGNQDVQGSPRTLLVAEYEKKNS